MEASTPSVAELTYSYVAARRNDSAVRAATAIATFYHELRTAAPTLTKAEAAAITAAWVRAGMG